MKTNPRHRFRGSLPSVLPFLAACLLGLAAFRASAQDVTSATSGPAPTPPPAIASNLADAKVAEEGDLDLQRAHKLYGTVLAEYDALRPRAAEALFRLAGVARKLGSIEEARQLYTRVSAEFQGIGDFAARSDAMLNDPQSPVTYRMSPELMARYGLTPKSAGATVQGGPGTAGGMDPALAARYGLGGAGALRERYGLSSGGATRAPEGGTLLIDPNTGQVLGAPSDGSGIDPNTGFPTGTHPAPEDAAAATGRSSGFATVDPNTGQPVPGRPGSPPPSSEILALRAEASANASRLRKLRREMRIAERPYEELPVALIEDPEFLARIRRYDLARETDRRAAATDAEPRSRDEARRELEMASSDLEHQRELHIRRLKSAVEVLETEAKQLELEIDQARAGALQKR